MIGESSVKCFKCNGSDSMLKIVYLDKNNKKLSDREFSAYRIMHPESKGSFQQVALCGLCMDSDMIGNQVQYSPLTSKRSKRKKETNYYVCPFCDTANEPLRNTCKQCDRILFSTQYETKRINSVAALKRKKGIKLRYVFALIFAAATMYFLLPMETDKPMILQTDFAEKVSSNVTKLTESKYTWPDGSRYVGKSLNGKPHGEGKLEWANGDVYTGEFSYGEITGYGTFKFANGTIHVGNRLNGKPNGEGEMKWTNGNEYTGEFTNGEITGYGSFRYFNGNTYIGTFYKGTPHGSGILYQADGATFEGQWVNGKLE